MVVFKILNKVTGQHYVGSCRGDVFERWELYVRAAEAGLDFPLYQELRELGEAQFSVVELDFSEDAAEVKEMELMYCIELSARSLRSYKYGLKDSVIKRCSQSDLDTAWLKDLPAEARPQPARRPTKAAPKPRPAAPAPVTPPVAAPKAAPEAPAAAPTQPSVAEATPATPTSAPQPRDIAAAEPQALEKQVIAEGVGVMVRALACAERLGQCQVEARRQAVAVEALLADSDQALAELQRRQERAATLARQALEAAEASQAANAALLESQRRSRSCVQQVAQALAEGEGAAGEVDTLQQTLKALLGRLKARADAGAAPPAAPQTPPVPPRVSAVPPQASAVSPQAATAPPQAPAAELEARIIEEQSGLMVNRLKQLDRLLVEAPPRAPEAVEAAAPSDAVEPEVTPDLQARAWVAPQGQEAGGPQLLPKSSVKATVVLRRPKGRGDADPRGAAGGRRPLLSRRRPELKPSR